MAIEPAPYLFSVDQFHRLAPDVFPEDTRVELLQGEIIQMAPIGSRHAACVNRLTRLFSIEGRDRVIVAVQNPVILSDWSEPQPDLALLSPRADYYASGHARPSDILLVVEVADTTATWDRRRKLPVYAAAGVSEVWLVDLNLGILEVHSDPGEASYREVHSFGPSDSVAPAALPDMSLSVGDILV